MWRWVVVLVAGLSVATAAASPPRGHSDNWSGYVVSGAKFTAVTGRWIQPAANCFEGPPGATDAAFWVGLGGNFGSSHQLEQIGTDADCDDNGNPTYEVWTEVWPADAIGVDLVVEPGDRIEASVKIGAASVHFLLRNLTRGTRYEHAFPLKHPDGSSAEWIAEAPAVALPHQQRLPFTNFGTIRFTHASATTAAGHSGPIGDPLWHYEVIDLIGDRGPRDPLVGFGRDLTAAHDRPSALAHGGTAFTVTWEKGRRPETRKAPPGAA